MTNSAAADSQQLVRNRAAATICLPIGRPKAHRAKRATMGPLVKLGARSLMLSAQHTNREMPSASTAICHPTLSHTEALAADLRLQLRDESVKSDGGENEDPAACVGGRPICQLIPPTVLSSAGPEQGWTNATDPMPQIQRDSASGVDRIVNHTLIASGVSDDFAPRTRPPLFNHTLIASGVSDDDFAPPPHLLNHTLIASGVSDDFVPPPHLCCSSGGGEEQGEETREERRARRAVQKHRKEARRLKKQRERERKADAAEGLQNVKQAGVSRRARSCSVSHERGPEDAASSEEAYSRKEARLLEKQSRGKGRGTR